MTRYTRPPFQFDRPVFCKIPQRARGRVFEVGSQFKWKELRVDDKVVQTMYVNGQLYHSDELEETLAPSIGDGLEELNIESLRKQVDKINEKVKSLADPKIPTCKISNIKAKQIGLLRGWRTAYGEYE